MISHDRLIWLLAHPLSIPPLSKLERRHTGRLRDNLLKGGKRGGGGRGAKSYDDKKAWSSINHSKLYGEVSSSS
jgi:hypothetical protein